MTDQVYTKAGTDALVAAAQDSAVSQSIDYTNTHAATPDDIPAPSDGNPRSLGVSAPGAGTAYSRYDHIHPMPSAADVGAATAAQGAKADAAIPDTLLDAKGDLIVASADNVPVRQPVGTDGARLVADSTQAAGVRWSSTLEFAGNGRPEGVVTAPVGSRYVDTAATLGAVLWVKVSGSGNTGWRAAHGDTGAVPVAYASGAGWTGGTLTLTRNGGLCQLSANGLARTAGASGWVTIYTLPNGYRPTAAVYATAVSGATTYLLRTTAAGTVDIINPGVIGAMFLTIQWLTSDVWPSVLPA